LCETNLTKKGVTSELCQQGISDAETPAGKSWKIIFIISRRKGSSSPTKSTHWKKNFVATFLWSKAAMIS
jgi:hypothetical protein